MNYLTESYEPKNVLRYFEDICSIPHGSFNEQKLARYILDIAHAYNLESYQDSIGNLLIRKPASKGYENIPSFLMQGHMDMVLVKSEDCQIDLDNEPIKLKLNNDILYADKTSLGADNAVGLSNMLAVMTSDDIISPPLEFLFTVQEEAGLVGIRNFDMSKIMSQRMITMDCGDHDLMVTSSAGSVKAYISKNSSLEPLRGITYKILISGLLGGHSGIDMGKNRGSAIYILGRMLCRLNDIIPVNIVSINTSANISNIPVSCECIIAFDKNHADNAVNIIKNFTLNIKTEYEESEKTIKIDFDTVCVQEKEMISLKNSIQIADLIMLFPYGVHNRSLYNLNWVTCSSLLTEIICENGFFVGKYAIRANSDEFKYSVLMKTKKICSLCGFKFEQMDDYPAWSIKHDSKLQKLALKTYEELYNSKLCFEPVHGGVEAGAISHAIPEMDIMGMAPKSRGAHTVKEHLYLDSVKLFWDFLTELLKNMCIENEICKIHS